MFRRRREKDLARGENSEYGRCWVEEWGDLRLLDPFFVVGSLDGGGAVPLLLSLLPASKKKFLSGLQNGNKREMRERAT